MTGSNKLERDELLDELQRLATELGDPPSIPEMIEHGQYSVPPYYREFGSWPAALRAAGFEASPAPDERSRDELLAEIQRLADDNDPPSQSQMETKGAYAVGTYSSHFGSWTAALREAGFDPPTSGTRISETELFDALAMLADDLGSPPTSTEMDEHGPYSAGTYINRFGSWDDGLAAAGLDSHTETQSVSDEQLVNELKRLAADLDQTPTTREMNEYGSYHAHTYRLHFGSWKDAVKSAGLEPVSNSPEPPNKIDREDLLAELRTLSAEDENLAPTTKTMKERGKYSVGTYINRFGSWNAAVSAAGLKDQ